MRISSLIVSSVIATSALSIAYGTGQANLEASNELALPLPNLPTNSDSPASDGVAPEPTTVPTEPSAADQTQSPEPSSTTAPSAKPTSATAKPTATNQVETAPVVTEKTSDPISYKYGTIQLAVTKTDGRITAVTLLLGDTSYGKDVAYAALIDATLQVQGTNYGNVSGATFTTDAFKKAVENVLKKF